MGCKLFPFPFPLHNRRGEGFTWALMGLYPTPSLLHDWEREMTVWIWEK